MVYTNRIQDTCRRRQRRRHILFPIRTEEADMNGYKTSTESMSALNDFVMPFYYAHPSSPPLSTPSILPLHLKVTSRLPRRMHLLMVVKLLARELALANFVLVLVRGDAVFGDAVAVAVFHGLGNVGGILGFVAMPWLGVIRSFRGRCRRWGLGGRGG